MTEDVVIDADFGGETVNLAYMNKEGDLFSVERFPNYEPGIWTEETKNKYWNNDLSEEDEKQLYKMCLGNLLENIKAYVEEASPIGIGIGSPGPLDPKEGVIEEPPNLPGWKDVPLREMIKQETGIPVWVNNDANVAALGEYEFGLGREGRYFLLNTLGTGMGWGAVVDDEIYEGEDGKALEMAFTQIALPGDDLLRNYDYYGSADGPYRILKRRLEMDGVSDVDAKLEDWFEGDELAIKQMGQWARENGKDEKRKRSKEAFKEYGRMVGRMLQPVINALEIHDYAYSGTGARDGDLFEDDLRDSVNRGIVVDDLSIEKAQLGERAGLVGAGALAFKELGKI